MSRQAGWLAVAIPVAGLHLVGAALLVAGLAAGGTGAALLLGLAVAAYTRGLIHSLDFDHIAMIDNSIRKFVADGRPTPTVGLAFSAGHSTVVVVSAILVIAGSQAVRGALDADSTVAGVLGLIGTTVAVLYLLIAALANSANLARLVRLWRTRGTTQSDQHALRVAPVGPWGRLLAAPMKRIRKPWHVYVAGVLFSLGFDTSTQIGLMVITGAAAFQGLSVWALLSLPLLFTAAMSLGDGVNGIVMGRIYQASQPVVQLRANIVLTVVSVLAAASVTITVGSGLLAELGVQVAPITWLADLDTTWAGAGVVIILLLAAGLTWSWRGARQLPAQ